MTLTYQFYFVIKMIFFGKEDRGKKVTGITSPFVGEKLK